VRPLHLYDARDKLGKRFEVLVTDRDRDES
jgi:hypothetical protein